MKHIAQHPPGTLVDCPMCEGKGHIFGEGCLRKQKRRIRVKFECMLCEGKKRIDAGVARDYLIEAGEKLQRERLAIARILDE